MTKIKRFLNRLRDVFEMLNTLDEVVDVYHAAAEAANDHREALKHRTTARDLYCREKMLLDDEIGEFTETCILFRRHNSRVINVPEMADMGGLTALFDDTGAAYRDAAYSVRQVEGRRLTMEITVPDDLNQTRLIRPETFAHSVEAIAHRVAASLLGSKFKADYEERDRDMRKLTPSRLRTELQRRQLEAYLEQFSD